MYVFGNIYQNPFGKMKGEKIHMKKGKESRSTHNQLMRSTHLPLFKINKKNKSV